MMEFAVLAVKSDDNFIILAEGNENELVEFSESICDSKNIKKSDVLLIKVDKDTYEDKKRYIETLNDYIESLMGC
jgi:hypothetical protein